MAFIGDGASNQGTVAEALNFSAVLKLPMIFMYENNGYSEFTGAGYHLGARTLPRVRQPSACRPRRWMASISSRSMTRWVVRVERARAAKARAQSRHSPCAGYGHFEGDMQKYRESKEVERLRKSARSARQVRRTRHPEFDIGADELREIDEEIGELIEDKVAIAKAAPKTDQRMRCTPTFTGATEMAEEIFSRSDHRSPADRDARDPASSCSAKTSSVGSAAPPVKSRRRAARSESRQAWLQNSAARA
jgi:pyruvate dehydrogenase E1 component alpha subunit